MSLTTSKDFNEYSDFQTSELSDLRDLLRQKDLKIQALLEQIENMKHINQQVYELVLDLKKNPTPY